MPLSVFAQIDTIRSLTELKLSDASDTILAVFDIDDTVTILKEPAFHRPNFKVHHAKIFANMMSSLTKEEQIVAFTLPLLTSPGVLLEDETPQVIQMLQGGGVKTIALTAALAGKIHNSFIEDRRISELDRVGITFSSSFPDMQETEFCTFPTPIFGRYPLFKDGIIFTNENDKGKVLVEFLRAIPWKPRLIVFVDDRLEHLHAVEKALGESFADIQFHGYHFQTDPACYSAVEESEFSHIWQEHVRLAKEALSPCETTGLS